MNQLGSTWVALGGNLEVILEEVLEGSWRGLGGVFEGILEGFLEG